MTQRSIEELVNRWRPRYLQASRKEKTLILDEFVALTGYHRKAAIRVRRKETRKEERGVKPCDRTFQPDGGSFRCCNTRPYPRHDPQR